MKDTLIYCHQGNEWEVYVNAINMNHNYWHLHLIANDLYAVSCFRGQIEGVEA